jgi:medium-chain acyl-[acyl-carrier-protein] hydrolase
MSETTAWVQRREREPQARLRLFCFPYAGGSAHVFSSWQAMLPPTVEVNPVLLPGRGSRLREPPFTRMRPLAEAALRALLPLFDRPFVLFGHSMGAAISFEITRLLRGGRGPRPLALFVSGCRALQLPDPQAPTYHLPEPEFLARLHELNGTPAGVLEHPELLRLLLPLLRADFELCQTYRYTPEPPLRLPIVAFGGTEDAEVDYAHLSAWREQTVGPFSLHMLPGDHFFINTSQPSLLRIISKELSSLPGQSS